MDTLSIKQRTNEDFLIALNQPALSQVVDFSAGVIRAQLRTTRESPLCIVEWSTIKGNIWWEPTKAVLSVWSQVAELYNLRLSGQYYIGCRLELLGYFYDIFEGDVTFTPGIVRP